MKIKEKKYLFLFATGFIVAGFLFAGIFFVKIVKIEDKYFLAELARDSKKQAKGLGGRDSLCSKCAMVFDFEKQGWHAFWMKNMRFDLDILWVADGKIVYIEKNFSHKSDKIVRPSFKADMVLEINAGLSDKYGIEIGDDVIIFNKRFLL